MGLSGRDGSLQCQESRVPSFDHQIGQCRRDRSSRRHRESRAGGPSHQTWWGGVWHRIARRQDRCVSARLSHHCRARPRQRGNTHNTQTQTEACTKKKTRTQTQIERETRTAMHSQHKSEILTLIHGRLLLCSSQCSGNQQGLLSKLETKKRQHCFFPNIPQQQVGRPSQSHAILACLFLGLPERESS